MPILQWVNGGDARSEAKNVPFHLLERIKTYGTPNENGESENLLVHGDNLIALRALLPFYRGQVKCIYIDPPYNTGSAFEHYDDNLEHSKWLSLIYPRLQLLREFLTDDGSIWVSIDEREYAYLKVIMDEIFGRKNFVDTVIWEKTDSPKNDAKLFYERHEYIHVYAKNIDNIFLKKDELSDEIPEHYNKLDSNNRRYYLKPLRVMGGNVSESLFFPMISPDGVAVLPYEKDGVTKSCWQWSKHKVEQEGERIEWVKGRKGWTPYFRIYADTRRATPLSTLWQNVEVGSNRTSKHEINALFPGNEFDTPKPEKLLAKIIRVASDPGDLVLDSFLGSGTTAAVAHKMGRRWIGIEMGEHAKTHCIPRLEKVIAGEQGGISQSVNWQGGGSFTFCELGEPVFDTWGNINPKVTFATLAAYLWQKETRTTTVPQKAPFLGAANGVGIYLLYNGILGDKAPASGNVLTRKLMKSLLADYPHEGPKIIYADAVVGITPRELEAAEITFKQIPYDVRG